MKSPKTLPRLGAARIALLVSLLSAVAVAACAEPPARSPNDARSQFSDRIDSR